MVNYFKIVNILIINAYIRPNFVFILEQDCEFRVNGNVTLSSFFLKFSHKLNHYYINYTIWPFWFNFSINIKQNKFKLFLTGRKWATVRYGRYPNTFSNISGGRSIRFMDFDVDTSTIVPDVLGSGIGGDWTLLCRIVFEDPASETVLEFSPQPPLLDCLVETMVPKNWYIEYDYNLKHRKCYFVQETIFIFILFKFTNNNFLLYYLRIIV